jgi:hypothetical protein
MVLLLSGLVAGCATNETTDQDRTRLEGAGVGALVGGLLGHAIGDGRGAAIGAVIGAGAGYLVGDEIAKRKQEYASTEDFLDGEIGRTQEFNSTASAYNQKLGLEIAALEKESGELRARYDQGRVDQRALAATRDDLQRRMDENRDLEETLAQELEVQTAILAQERNGRDANDPYLARLENEIKLLQKNLDTLREGSTQLARIDQRLSV